MGALDFLEQELEALEQQGLLRAPESPRPDLIDFCSNDYLGYARQPVSRATLLECEGSRAGAGASRLIYGTAPEHLELETELATWVGLPSTLLFSSGYAANVGLLSALIRPGDTVVSDALNHASLIDGCRLSRAQVAVVPHRDLEAVGRALAQGRGRRWVLTESYFSMDGDVANLAGLRAVCDEHAAALLVDEAHALGVFGPEGGGLCRASGVVPDALVGTLGKAVGVHGAFVAGSTLLRSWLWNRARSGVFSTAPSPLVARLAALHVRRARRDDTAREHLMAASRHLAERLRAAGLSVPRDAIGPIVPVLMGDNRLALHVAAVSRSAGFRVQAIRPPTVPRGAARLRLTISALTSLTDVERLTECLTLACTVSSSSETEPASERPTSPEP